MGQIFERYLASTMRFVVLFITLFLCYTTQHIAAQPAGFGYTRSYAIQLGEGNLIKTPDEGTRLPMFTSTASSEFAYFSERIRGGADLSLRKNTFSFGERSNGVLETIHTFVPVYVNFFMNSTFFVECGGYVGLMANSGDISKTEFVSLKHWDYLKVKFDYGFISGVGIRLSQKGKLNFRYNHGMQKVVPINRSTILESRIIELAMTFKI